MRAAVAAHAARGVDVIKVMASGGFITPGSAAERPQFGPDELRAAVEAAHAHGLPLTAHAHSTAAIALAVDAGVDGIEHCSFVTADGVDAPAELVELIARRRIVVGATLGMLPGTDPPPAIAALVDAFFANTARLHQAGAAIVAGTDAGVGPPKPHGVLPHAARDLARIGFTNGEALRSMTADAAGVCGIGSRTGRIAPGMDADLLVVRGDPLADLGALHDVVAVYHRGRRVR
ncbi:MAG: amidohydrolase family protein [Acidimicrobiia bacterium]